MVQLRIIFGCFLITAGLVFLPSCTSSQNDAHAQKKTGLVVINVLKKELYDDCHIKDSVSVPFDQVDTYAQTHLDKDAEIVVYCSNYMCSASGAVAQKLQDLGFKNVHAYEAGTAEWYQQGLPTEGPAKAGYLAVKMEPHHEDNSNVRVISTQELAQKMKVEKKI
jgi:rhodanese-related sulfurtransferase